jgi:GAF domain-containing protein
VDDLLGPIVRSARAVFDSAACSIALLDHSSDELIFRVADGAGADAIVGRRIASNAGLAGWAVTSGQALSVSDLRTDPRFARDIAAETGYIPSTILVAPLLSEDDALGVIQVLDPAPGGPGLAVLGGFAAQATAVVLTARSTAAGLDLGADLLALQRIGPDEAELARAVLAAVRTYVEAVRAR